MDKAHQRLAILCAEMAEAVAVAQHKGEIFGPLVHPDRCKKCIEPVVGDRRVKPVIEWWAGARSFLIRHR